MQSTSNYSTFPSDENANGDSKLSIYDPPEETVILEKLAPNPLHSRIQKGRKVLNEKYRSSREKLDGLVDMWILVEDKIEKGINLVKERTGERIMPGGLYVIIAGMAGSILSRNRMFPVRVVTPVAASIGAAVYFLPQTTRSICGLVKRNIPVKKVD